MCEIIDFNKVGIPIYNSGSDIDPKTITDKLYIGAHISWKEDRCAGRDYALYSSGSGIIFDIGPVHIFVMTDIDQNNFVHMHFYRAFRLDSVILQGIQLIENDVPDNIVKYQNTSNFRPENYSEYQLMPNSTTSIVSKYYNDLNYCQTLYFLEEGVLYDYFKHRDMYGKPMGITIFLKAKRPANLDLTPYKTEMEKYAENN